MMRQLGLGAALWLVACSGGETIRNDRTSGGGTGVGGSGPNGGSGATNPGAGGSGAAAATGGTPGGGMTSTGGAMQGTGGKPVGSSLDCAAPATGSPVLRLFTRFELENTINDVFPGIKGQWVSSLPAGSVADSGFDNDAGIVPGNQFVGGLSETAQSIATALVGSGFATLLPCSSGAADRACAGTFVEQYGRRLFRRPLTQAEKDRYLTLFDSLRAATDFKASIKWIATGLIQSPNAVFRSEIGTLAGGVRTLSAYEQASELSYTFAGSTPSEELLTKAASGSLGDPVAIAKSLLATEGGKRSLQRFFEGYLGYTKVSSITKLNVSNFSALGPEMVQEARAFIDDVVIQKNGGLKQLLTANTSNPSKTLATFYGFPAPANDYATTPRPAGRGLGVLALGAFLGSHANGDASSPTQRGLFPFFRLLCGPPLKAPKDVPSIGESPVTATNTTRERYEVTHLSKGTACNSCHRLFDPIGFGFENFDEVGRYRDMQGGSKINAAAAVLGPDAVTPLFSFTSQEELVTGLANQAVTYQCFTAYLATYAFGSSDSCLGPTQAPALQAGTVGIVDALAGLAAEPHFSKRKAQ